MQDYSKCQSNNSIKGFDLVHQIFRLRYTKNLPDSEALAIMGTLANSVKTYDQIVEVGWPQENSHVNHTSKTILLASCFVTTWGWSALSWLLSLPSKRSHQGVHRRSFQPIACIPSKRPEFKSLSIQTDLMIGRRFISAKLESLSTICICSTSTCEGKKTTSWTAATVLHRNYIPGAKWCAFPLQFYNKWNVLILNFEACVPLLSIWHNFV